MAYFRTYPMPNSAILRLNSEKDRIDVNPDYQRRGEIWTLEKKQLLIDSILNDYDIPKLYFHALHSNDSNNEFDYSIIDGRQRLETIWGFTNDEFPLSEDFVYLADPSITPAGMRYSELSSNYPKLKIRFDSFTLPIICIETDEIELIEDMFSRLNEAVPLNAAEKRNAIGGPMAICIRDIADHSFFNKCVKFTDKRYQYREVSARLLFIEYSLIYNKRIVDTKKPYLDNMVHSYKKGESTQLDAIKQKTVLVLDTLINKFYKDDSLLRTQSSIPIYYLVMRTAIRNQCVDKFTREKISSFYKELEKNRIIASKDLAKAKFEYLEYDRMSQQGTNDAASIKERTRILCDFLEIGVPEDWPKE